MSENFWRIHNGVTLTPQASAPTSPNDGDMYYDSTLNKLRVYQNGTWVSLSDSDGTILLDNGSAGAPSLAFTSDPDTGLFRSSANTLAFATNGTNVGSVDPNSTWVLGSSTGTRLHTINGSMFVNHTDTSAVYLEVNNNSLGAGDAYILIDVDGTGSPQLGFETPDGNVTMGIHTDNHFRLTRASTLLSSIDVDIADDGTITAGVAGSSRNHVINGAILTFQGSQNGLITFDIDNNNAGGSAATKIRIGTSGAADAWTHYVTNDTNAWSAGLLHSSDSFVIAESTTLASNNYFKIASGGAVTLGAPGGTQTHTLNGSGIEQTTTGSAFHRVQSTGASGTAQVRLQTKATDGGNTYFQLVPRGSTSFAIGTVAGETSLKFESGAFGSGSVRGVIDQDGNWTLGSSTSNTQTLNGSVLISSRFANGGALGSGSMLKLNGNDRTGTTQINIDGTTFTGSSAATSGIYGFLSGVTTSAASYTSGFVTNFYSQNITKGSGSTITRRVGYYVEPATGGTNNAAIADNASFSGNYFINSTSTNPSVIAGALTLGTASTSTHTLNTVTATSATAGSNGDVPAQVDGYITININGVAKKIPYYAT